MLTLGYNRRHQPIIRWSERDEIVMARLLGADTASDRRMPLQPSVLYAAAHTKTLKLSPKLAAALEAAERLRAQVDRLATAALPADLARHNNWWDHQRRDILHMRTLKLPSYLLGHEPGVGKTLPALVMARRVWLGERILIICPNTAKLQWTRAITRWISADESIRRVEGTIREQEDIIARDGRWCVGHWESLVHAADAYLDRPWDVVILDEAHRITNRKAQRSETAFHLAAAYRLALTGHPYTNTPSELFAILRFLYPVQYKAFWRFVGQHVHVEPKPFAGFDFGGPRAPKLLRWEIAPFTLRRTLLEAFPSMPRITRTAIECELTTRGRAEYERLKREIFVELDALDGATKVLPIINDLSRLTRLRQYLVDPALVGAREPSVKFAAVGEWLDDLDRPTVLFTSFRQAGVNLIAYLKRTRGKLRVGFVHGGMTNAASDKIQLGFQRGTYDLVVMVTAAAKESLNYGGHGYVGLLDLPWNPRDLEQSEGRVNRPEEGTGKIVATTAYRFIIPGSYEEKLEARLEQKYDDFTRVFTVSYLRKLFA